MKNKPTGREPNAMSRQIRTWELQESRQLTDGLLDLFCELRFMPSACDCENHLLLPLWQVFPDYERTSLGWRMGSGERYRWGWHDWFDGLSEAGRAKYIERFPEPEKNGWPGFYAMVLKETPSDGERSLRGSTLKPIWRYFPGISKGHGSWRDLNCPETRTWKRLFLYMNGLERLVYKLKNPEPEGWKGYYRSLLEKPREKG